jgi:glucokinase
VVDGSEMAAALGMEEVRLINDFVANGYGLLTLDEATETVTIQVRVSVSSMRPCLCTRLCTVGR